jgi:Icc protein
MNGYSLSASPPSVSMGLRNRFGLYGAYFFGMAGIGLTIETVEFRVDDGWWVKMNPVDDRIWNAPLASAQLTKGRHRLAVSVETMNDAGEREIEFAVDPTGRYTAIPIVRPIVTATNFC